MLFNSIDFLIFFPIVIAVYYIIPARFRYIWVLLASYYFYMQWNPEYILLLFTSTIVTYAGGLIVEKVSNVRIRRIALVAAILINLGILGFFKYTNMFMGYVNKIISLTGRTEIPWDNPIVLPVGISFFTLQALGYLIDVYRGDIYAEHNFLRYALFISFFPQLVAGPIERSKNLLKQLAETHKFSLDNLRKGLLIMLYGFFMKVVIADRISVMVDTVYNNPENYPGMFIFVATALFSVQLYCDFYGYSTIAKGAAMTMGIRLMDNFNAPYLAQSIDEFWRRWHLSLSTWFRDYLYIPLGGNRKGKVRKYINLLIVFTVSGFWHGASLSFLIWGTVQGLYQMIGTGKNYLLEKLRLKTGIGYEPGTKIPVPVLIIKIVITKIIFDFSLMIFRANSLSNYKVLMKQLFAQNNWNILYDGSLFNLGVSQDVFIVVAIAVLVLLAVDIVKYTGHDLVETFYKRKWIVRTAMVLFLLLYIIMYGCYGRTYDTQQFIYFQF